MSLPPWFRMGILVVVGFLVVEAVLPGLRFAGVHPDILLGLTIVVGMRGGAERGAVVGFVLGLAADVMLPTPLGLSALVWCLVGFSMGAIGAAFHPSHPVTLVAVMLVASAAGEVLFALIGTLLGQPAMLTAHLAFIVGVVALINALVSPILMWGVGWVLRPAPAPRSFTP